MSATGQQPRRDIDEAEHRLRQHQQHHHHPHRSSNGAGRLPRESSHLVDAHQAEDGNVAVPVARPSSRYTRGRDGDHYRPDSDEDDEDVQEDDLAENGDGTSTLLTSVSSRGRIRRINPRVRKIFGE